MTNSLIAHTDTIRQICNELLVEGRGPNRRAAKLAVAREAVVAAQQLHADAYAAKRLEECLSGIDLVLANPAANGKPMVRESNLRYIASKAFEASRDPAFR